MKKETLCWTCGNAYGGTICPWFNLNLKKPVENWIADNPKNIKDSYRVIECPLYIKEDKKHYGIFIKEYCMRHNVSLRTYHKRKQKGLIK